MENFASLNVREMLKSGDPYVRRGACEHVGESKIADYVPDLVEVLSDENIGVKESAVNALTSIGGQAVANAVVPLLKSEDASRRNIGFEILCHIGPDASEALSKLLNDTDDDVIKFSVDIIANARDSRFASVLSPLLFHRNPNIRASAAVSLGKINALDSVSLLIKALNDAEEWVRFSAIEGIGLLGDGAALSALFEVIGRDSGLIKEAALDAVSKIAKHEDAAPALEKIEVFLKKGQILSIGAVLELMEKALVPGSTFRPDKEFKEVFVRFFLKAAEDNDKDSRLKALKGLALLKSQEGLVRLFNYADSLKEIDEDTENFLVDIIVAIVGHGALPHLLIDELAKGRKTAKIIVRAMGGIKTEEVVPILEGMMDMPTKGVSREIVSALESVGSFSSAAALARLLQNSDGHTRKTAARALARLIGDDSVGPLFEALRNETYRDVMEEIVDILSTIPTDSVKAGLYKLLKDKRSVMREMAARGLGRIGDESTLQPLRDALNDTSTEVRKAAYKSMAMLGTPEAAQDILRGLCDRDTEVRLSVLQGLSGWCGDNIRAALIDALKDDNKWIRYYAVRLLGEQQDASIEDIVIERLLNDEPPVKAEAAKALEKMSSVNAVPVLKKFIDHPDPTVRSAVERAIEVLSC